MTNCLLRAVVAVIVECACASAALAEPLVSVNTRYYTISGTTAGELKAQIATQRNQGLLGLHKLVRPLE